MEGFAVEVFATSWIEIIQLADSTVHISVEVFATSWIEISVAYSSHSKFSSRSLRPRGLKSRSFLYCSSSIVEVFATSWIEMISIKKQI